MNEGTGLVTLVGAGPGDPELLTLGAARALAQADVVVYDHLIPENVLELAQGAVLIPVGKTPYGEQTAQETIHSILVREGSLGRNVVRLKGGDPFVFGRGTEEIEALHRAGIPFRVIPGVSSINGVLSAVGLAVTKRGRNHGFAVVSGAGTTDTAEIRNWASFEGPVVILMGVRRAAEIAREFIAGGREANTPVTVVARGGTREERILETNLRDLPQRLHEPAEWTPAIIVVGAELEPAARSGAMRRDEQFKRAKMDQALPLRSGAGPHSAPNLKLEVAQSRSCRSS